MASVRQAPPTPLYPVLTRARLLAVLRRRWEQRVMAVVAGAGFGKTTLLAQALAENEFDPAGIDCWMACTSDHGAASVLGAALCESVDVELPDDESSLPGMIAAAIASRAPTDVCLVLDDCHLVPADSGGARLLAELSTRLPTNGHLVVAGRKLTPVPLARLVARGEATRLEETDLAFDDVELRAFAELRGVDVETLQGVAPWPALAELVASTGSHMVGEFVWEENLSALSPGCRRQLAVLAAVGGGDAEAIAAALGHDVDLALLTADIPLTQRSADGSVRLHALWEEHLIDELSDAERREVSVRAGCHFTDRGEFLRAFRLLSSVEAWPEVLVLFRAVLAEAHSQVPVEVLEQWLDALPEPMRAEPEAALVRGAVGRDHLDDLEASTQAFREAADAFRARGDVDGEVMCIGALGQNAMWGEELDRLGDLYGRVVVLERTGHPQAHFYASFGRALMADLSGEHGKAIAELDSISTAAASDDWAALVARLRCENFIAVGEPTSAVAALEGISRTAGPIAQSMADDTLVLALWLAGRIDEALTLGDSTAVRVRGFGNSPVLGSVAAQASRLEALCGNTDRARALLDIAEDVDATVPTAHFRTVSAQVALRIAIGDESGAKALLDHWVEEDEFVTGLARNRSRMALPFTYVLVPSLRSQWDAAPLGPCYVEARALARAVVQLREGMPAARALSGIDLSDPALVRRWLPVPWAVLVAVGAISEGQSAGRVLLDSLGPPARQWLVDLVSSSSRALVVTAKRLLADLPATPAQQLRVRLLGPIELHRGEEAVDSAEWRRGRVRELLGHLIVHRSAPREAIIDALWPELDAAAGANNLRVTLSYLLRVLEPDRREKDASFFVRQEGPIVELTGEDKLDVDLWMFEEHLDAASAAERDGVLSSALEHYRSAVAVWRGAFFPESAWAEAEAARLRVRFLEAATRAGELALAAGELDEPERLATRVLTLEPWSERAYRLLIATYLAHGDRPAALRALERCHSMLEDLGVEPGAQTQMLERRLDGTMFAR